MTTLILDKDLSEQLELLIESLPECEIHETNLEPLQSAIEKLPVDGQSLLNLVGEFCSKLLKENGYVHLCSFPMTRDVRDILCLGLIIGVLFNDLGQQSSTVVPASPQIGARLQGNQTKALFPHTDFAMLEKPPSVSIIHCRQSDPLGAKYGVNGVSVAQDIVSRYYGSTMLDEFCNVELPFAGRTPAGEDIIIHTPILHLAEKPGELAMVRFHPSRIHHGFRVQDKKPSEQQTRVLRNFLAVSKEIRINIPLKSTDFLLVSNRHALHDRGRCSLQLGRTEVQARLTHILFVQELYNK